MQIEHGKLYLTKGNYIVEIVSDRDGFFATPRTSPGTLDKCTIVEYCKTFRMDWAKKHGWLYERSGKIAQSYHSLYSELEIVAEYPYKFIDPPKGFTWLGGFPQLQGPKMGEYYVSYVNHYGVFRYTSSVTIKDSPVIGTKRIALVKVATTSPEPFVALPPQEQYYIANRKSIFASGIYWVKKSGVWHFTNQHVADVTDYSRDELFQRGINNKDLIPCSKEEALAHFEKATKKEDVVSASQESWPKYYVHHNIPKGWGVVRNKDGQCDFIKMRERIEHEPFQWDHDKFVECGTYKEVTKEELIARFDEDPFSSQKIETKSLKIGEVPPKPVAASTPTIAGPVTPTKSTVSLPVSSPKEVKMNKNTFVSVVKSVGGSALRATKHLYIEPAMIVGGHIKRSLRYVVFFGTIAGAIYGANNPEKLKKNVMAYMPKVTIEAPEIMK